MVSTEQVAVTVVRVGLQPSQLSSTTGTAQTHPGLDAETLGEKLVKIGVKVVPHAKYVVFQWAEVSLPRPLFAAIVNQIRRLRLACASG